MEEEAGSSSSRPVKSILKQSSSFDQQEKHHRNKSTKWDEMNIMKTYHPPDKDYGHMKVEEPKTPYNWEFQDDTDGPSQSQLDPSLLSEKLASASTSRRTSTPSASEDESEDDSQLSVSELAKKREFKNRRKMHYNEFNAVQRARRLIAEEEEDEDASTLSSLSSSAMIIMGASQEGVPDDV